MGIERIVPSDPGHWFHLGLHHLQRYEFALPYCRGRTVVDLACGCGYGAYCLAKNSANSVVGLDRNQEAIEYANRNYRLPNLTFRQYEWNPADPPHTSVDVIVSFETIEHLQDPLAFVAWIAKSLTSEGAFLVSAPNALMYSRSATPCVNRYHLNEPDYETLCCWLSQDFIIRSEWEQSAVCTDEFPQSQLIFQSRLIRALLGFENLVRKFSGRRVLDLQCSKAECEARYSVIRDRIFPLLPERTNRAEVFIFDCIKRTAG
jgi:SAM-dependent methyltransferase